MRFAPLSYVKNQKSECPVTVERPLLRCRFRAGYLVRQGERGRRALGRGGRGRPVPGSPGNATGSLRAFHRPPIMYTLVTGHAFFNHIHI